MEEVHKKVIEVQENAPIKPLMQDAETQVSWSLLAHSVSIEQNTFCFCSITKLLNQKFLLSNNLMIKAHLFV